MLDAPSRLHGAEELEGVKAEADEISDTDTEFANVFVFITDTVNKAPLLLDIWDSLVAVAQNCGTTD